MKERHGVLVGFVVTAYPQLQMGEVTVGIEFLHLFLIDAWKAVNGDEGIVTQPLSLTDNIYLTTPRFLSVVGTGHDAFAHQFTGRDAQFAFVVLHCAPPLP